MPDGSASKAGWVAMMRAVIARGSMEQMRADALQAAEGVSRDGAWWPTAVLVLGYSHLLVGETDRADELFADSLAAADAAWRFGERPTSRPPSDRSSPSRPEMAMRPQRSPARLER